jgi:hypothetical protein
VRLSVLVLGACVGGSLPAFAESPRLANGTPVWEFFAACAGAALHEEAWARGHGQTMLAAKANRVYLQMFAQARKRMNPEEFGDPFETKGEVEAEQQIVREYAEDRAAALEAADRVKTSLARPSWVAYIACETILDDVSAKKTTWDAVVAAGGKSPG